MEPTRKLRKKYPISEYPVVPVRKGPRDNRAISSFYNNLNPGSCHVICSDKNCRGHTDGLELFYDYRGENVFAKCRVCRQRIKIFPEIFRGLKGNIVDLHDALVKFCNKASSESIMLDTGLSKKTVHTLKFRYRALLRKGREQIDDPLLFGGNKGRNRVEADELEKGYRKKGAHGHCGKIQNQIWGVRGITVEGEKKWLLLPFYENTEGPAQYKSIKPLIDKYIADETWLCTDGLRAYLSYDQKNPERKFILYQLSHSKGEYTREEKHKNYDGEVSNEVMHTNDIDGGWSDFRNKDIADGKNGQSTIVGFCEDMMFQYNHRDENKFMVLVSYMHLEVGTHENCKNILSFRHGRVIWKKKRQKRKNYKVKSNKEVEDTGPKWRCVCGTEVKNHAANRYQHRGLCDEWQQHIKLKKVVEPQSRGFGKTVGKNTKYYLCKQCKRAGKKTFLFKNKSQHVARHNAHKIK